MPYKNIAKIKIDERKEKIGYIILLMKGITFIISEAKDKRIAIIKNDRPCFAHVIAYLSFLQ